MQEERARKYAQEVQSLQFNILVTTYEFIMRDRTKLSKVSQPVPGPRAVGVVWDWRYTVIDSGLAWQYTATDNVHRLNVLPCTAPCCAARRWTGSTS